MNTESRYHDLGGMCIAAMLALTPCALHAQAPASAEAPAPKKAPLEVQVRTAIADLGAESWNSRNAADARLRVLGKENETGVLRDLLEAYVGGEDPEIQHRARDIMHDIVVAQVFHQHKGYMGVRLGLQPRPIKVGDVEYHPIVVEQVMPNTAAQAARVMNGDKIIRIDHNVCTAAFGVADLIKYVAAKKPGTKVQLIVWSGGKEAIRDITLGQRPNFPTDPPPESQKEEFFNQWLNEKLRETRQRLGLTLDSSG